MDGEATHQRAHVRMGARQVDDADELGLAGEGDRAQEMKPARGQPRLARRGASREGLSVRGGKCGARHIRDTTLDGARRRGQHAGDSSVCNWTGGCILGRGTAHALFPALSGAADGPSAPSASLLVP